jgi:hypothetical protein
MAEFWTLAVNALELPVLLVERLNGESVEELLEFLKARHTARPDDQPGPVYSVGTTYRCRGRKFSQVCSCAEALALRMIFDHCGRSTIVRLRPDLPLRLFSPDKPTVDIGDNELVEEKE